MPFWLEPDSFFGSLKFKTFTNGSHMLTIPASLALSRMKLPDLLGTLQHRCNHLSVFGTLFLELQTQRLPATPVKVGSSYGTEGSLNLSLDVD
jgi:hypothetical protein